jgi:hypothetical protein
MGLQHGVRATTTAAVLCGVLLSATACEAPPARAAQAPAVTVWRPLGQWAGSGSRQTESFDVASGALRLQWEVRDTGAGAGPFRVWLHSAISGRPLQLLVERKGPGAGTAHVADEPRVSYLVIEGDGVAWTAALHEATAVAASR